ncbi:MAG TPA: UDP-N-acetylmuramoyl-tripeptide--D-alanyl-D-alanine ligase [Aliiroseovarius sp.]|nr:UDP-N-acetylmuramoyl-tripeptide--D-alanyl-D-alanine ligase [Aliiroseovarius sp.]
MSLWTAHDAAAATGGTAQGEWAAQGVSIDTRSLQKGDLFVALKDVRDGHDFVAQALDKGAAAALVSHVPNGVAPDAPLLIVPDVLAGLEALGKAARARTQARVVAVTGSVGKTSTKEMLRVVLERQGKVSAAQASYNNHWGVPLTLARLPADADFAVIEIGMNHPGEIAPLAKMARPHVAMITTIAAAHLAAFDDIAGIAREKATIFQGLEPGGVAVVNGDLDTSPVLKAGAGGFACVTFGAGADNDYRLSDVTLQGDSTIIQAALPEGPQLLRLSCAGRHFASNALGVLAVVDALGGDVTLAARDLSLWQPHAGRGVRETVVLDPVEGLAFTLFDDAYNANPTSMAAALEVLSVAETGRAGRRIAILGDMLELGPDEGRMHQDLAALPWMDAVDKVHCVGARMHALWQDLSAEKQGQWVEKAEDLLPRIHRLVRPGDVVLVKGSLGARVGQVVDALRKLGHPLEQETRGT